MRFPERTVAGSVVVGGQQFEARWTSRVSRVVGGVQAIAGTLRIAFSVVVLVFGGTGLERASCAVEGAEPIRLTADGQLKQRPQWSPDGKQLLFARHRGTEIFLWLLALDNNVERRLTTNTDPEFDAAFSPDGKRLLFAFDKASPNQGDIEIYLIGIDGKEQRPCVATQGALSHEEWPAWSPDGQRFAFTTTRYGNQELCIAGSDGKNEIRLTSDPALDMHPAWSPDGKRIAFATGRWGGLEIALIDPDGKNLSRVTEGGGFDDYPAWSPDGKKLAFVSNRTGNLDVYTANPDGSEVTNITNHPGIDTFPTFSPRGELTWVGQRATGFDIFLLPLP